MLIQPTIEKLKALKLYGMLNALQILMDNPENTALSFEEKLGMMVDQECIYRDNKRQERLLGIAHLRFTQACVENIDYQYARKLDKNLILTLTLCDWIRRQQNLIFLGPTGVGKSYLVCALGHQACRQGLSVRYYRVPRLFEMFRIAQGEGRYTRFLKELSKTDLLILDDWGLDQLNKEARHDLLEILEDRHVLRSTAITTQLPLHLWHDYIGEATMADAILDRLLTNSHKIELEGDSMRPKETKI